MARVMEAEVTDAAVSKVTEEVSKVMEAVMMASEALAATVGAVDGY